MKNTPVIPKWPFYLGDILLISIGFTILLSADSLHQSDYIWSVGCILVGAILFVTPFILEFMQAVKWSSEKPFQSDLNEIQRLNGVIEEFQSIKKILSDQIEAQEHGVVLLESLLKRLANGLVDFNDNLAVLNELKEPLLNHLHVSACSGLEQSRNKTREKNFRASDSAKDLLDQNNSTTPQQNDFPRSMAFHRMPGDESITSKLLLESDRVLNIIKAGPPVAAYASFESPQRTDAHCEDELQINQNFKTLTHHTQGPVKLECGIDTEGNDLQDAHDMRRGREEAIDDKENGDAEDEEYEDLETESDDCEDNDGDWDEAEADESEDLDADCGNDMYGEDSDREGEENDDCVDGEDGDWSEDSDSEREGYRTENDSYNDFVEERIEKKEAVESNTNSGGVFAEEKKDFAFDTRKSYDRGNAFSSPDNRDWDNKGKNETATTIVAHLMMGIGNKPFIRGEGPGLSWEKGVPMDFVEVGKWKWTTFEGDQPIKCKIYKNDQVPEQGDPLNIDSGGILNIHPRF